MKAFKKETYTHRRKSVERMNLALQSEKLGDLEDLTPRERELVMEARLNGETTLTDRAVVLPSGPMNAGRNPTTYFNLESYALEASLDRQATLHREQIWLGLKGRPVLRQER